MVIFLFSSYLRLFISNFSEHDLRLAQHITHVHMSGAAPQVNQNDVSTLGGGLYSLSELRRLIAVAKAQQAPAVPAHLADYLVGAYVEMRKEARVNKEMTYTSARFVYFLLIDVKPLY